MTERLLLATDLDRTLLPNGPQPESPRARERFGALVRRPDVRLAYVTGRHRALIEEAIAEYLLPSPDFVIGDVGTMIYEVTAGEWRSNADWVEEIGTDWSGRRAVELAELFEDMDEISLQEPERQGDHKLSFYAEPRVRHRALVEEMERRLREAGLRSAVINSVDAVRRRGLVDVLPARATKRHALEFLLARLGFRMTEAVFAGDSGNDLAVLASPLRAVLVANAGDDVKRRACALSTDRGWEELLYVARGGWRGMNGNYAAGILEGVAHYEPETADWYE